MHTMVIDQDRERRDEVVRLGLWIFLATVAMLFAAFGSAYLVRRGSSDWTHVTLPPVLWLNTAVLVASSIAVEAGRTFGRAGRWTPASASFGAAIGLGLGFLGGQLIAWQALMEQGVRLQNGPHGAFFYMLTGAHGVHVVAALVVLATAATRTWTENGRLDRERWARTVDASRTFWHFLLGAWLFVFLLLSFY